MIHTGEFFIVLDEEDIETLKFKHMIDFKKINIDITGVKRLYGTRIMLRKIRAKVISTTATQWRVYIFVNFPELISKTHITIEHSDIILDKLNNYISDLLGRKKDIFISRIDYKYDALVKDQFKRKVLIKLYKKCLDKTCYMTKDTRYKTSIRYNSKSRNDNIYDKQIERIANSKAIKNYEKDVMRYEAQIRNKHIYYKYNKHNFLRVFENYFNDDIYYEYMNKMIVKVLHTGDYYNFYHASKIINNLNLKEKDEKDIKEFLKIISKKGGTLSKAKQKFGSYKYNKYIKILESANINPIIIPKHDKFTYIENPLKKLYLK